MAPADRRNTYRVRMCCKAYPEQDNGQKKAFLKQKHLVSSPVGGTTGGRCGKLLETI